jgi:hypothetical protein
MQIIKTLNAIIFYNFTGLLAQLAERRARYPQGSGFEPCLFHKAYYMPFSCHWRFEMKLSFSPFYYFA